MKTPRFELDDTVIVNNTKTPKMVTIESAEWHTGYSQWLFNKDTDTEVFENQITHYYSVKKGKWIKL
jgi:hypothetical protein